MGHRLKVLQWTGSYWLIVAWERLTIKVLTEISPKKILTFVKNQLISLSRWNLLTFVLSDNCEEIKRLKLFSSDSDTKKNSCYETLFYEGSNKFVGSFVPRSATTCFYRIFLWQLGERARLATWTAKVLFPSKFKLKNRQASATNE